MERKEDKTVDILPTEKEINERFKIDYKYGIDCSPEATVNHCDEWNYENELRREGVKWAIEIITNKIKNK